MEATKEIIHDTKNWRENGKVDGIDQLIEEREGFVGVAGAAPSGEASRTYHTNQQQAPQGVSIHEDVLGVLLRRQADLEAQLMNAIEQNQNQTAGREKPPYKGRHSIDDEELMLTEGLDSLLREQFDMYDASDNQNGMIDTHKEMWGLTLNLTQQIGGKNQQHFRAAGGGKELKETLQHLTKKYSDSYLEKHSFTYESYMVWYAAMVLDPYYEYFVDDLIPEPRDDDDSLDSEEEAIEAMQSSDLKIDPDTLVNVMDICSTRRKGPDSEKVEYGYWWIQRQEPRSDEWQSLGPPKRPEPVEDTATIVTTPNTSPPAEDEGPSIVPEGRTKNANCGCRGCDAQPDCSIM